MLEFTCYRSNTAIINTPSQKKGTTIPPVHRLKPQDSFASPFFLTVHIQSTDKAWSPHLQNTPLSAHLSSLAWATGAAAGQLHWPVLPVWPPCPMYHRPSRLTFSKQTLCKWSSEPQTSCYFRSPHASTPTPCTPTPLHMLSAPLGTPLQLV